ncbi:DUF6943 family protein [Jiulongibacter sp. NS-SX5]|uniref:DUF6943 family protein n=1 Tax=Jiulongibacter sp. NS-SX5 TaxID=3463854 RepID=UPI0040587880
MQFTVKTYSPRQPIHQNGFFVLSKGLNSGRPISEPCPNSYQVICHTLEEKETLELLCFCLWQSKVFYLDLVGSVIPFLRIGDFRKALLKAIECSIDKPELNKLSGNIQKLNALESQYRTQLKLVGEYKKALYLSLSSVSGFTLGGI